MNEKKMKVDETGKKNPFKTPEGYFEDLNRQIMSRLGADKQEAPKPVGWWEKAKPVAYLAAMLAGAALLFNVFRTNVNTKDRYAEAFREGENPEWVVWENEDAEELYDYLEHQVISQHYRETVFIGE